MTPVPWAGLIVYLGVLAGERLGELVLSHRHARELEARGAVERGAGHFWMFVLLHALYPVALVTEVIHGARPARWWPAMLGLWLLAQALRIASMRTLGVRWNARIIVLPGEPRSRRGIYRWLAHPNYVAVAIEFVAAPLMFGAWRTALAGSLANALAMTIRIPLEVRALEEAARSPRPTGR